MWPRDNWERLVTAVVRRQQLWELCHADSRTPSFCSAVSDEESDDEESPNEESPVESYSEKGRLENASNGGRVRGLIRLQWQNFVRKKGKAKYVKRENPSHGIVPKAAGGEHAAAGLPSWLAVVAGGARADPFEKLDQVLRVDGNLAFASYEALPSVRDVPSSEKQLLFIWKVKMCRVKFDFTDPAKDLREKGVKRLILLELADCVTYANGKFTENVIEEAVKMVSLNICRDFAPRPREKMASFDKFIELAPQTWGDSIESEQDESALDPAWSHLQAVYEFLLKFVSSPETDSKVAKRYIDQHFVVEFLGLFDSEDPRERDYLKVILHRIYGKFMLHRPYIRKWMHDIFSQFVFETEKHNGIAELLEIIGSIINGFVLPLKEEHKLFLVRALIPLHKPKSLDMYHAQLSYCITQFVEKDCKLADTIIRGLIKYWPVTNSSKEVLFLGELEEVLEMTQAPEFKCFMVPLFHQISHSLISLHFQVAERALSLWNNDHIKNLIRQNRKVILPLIFPALEKNAGHHWNQSVQSLNLNVREFFYELDPDLFKACQTEFQNDKSKENDTRERREAAWKCLEELAAKATTNEAILVP